MDFRAFLQDHIVMLDGGMGTLLQARGLAPGEAPEGWNITHPEEIKAIHRAYFEAGSNVVCTNTFGANRLKYDRDGLADIVSAAVRIAKSAAGDRPDRFVALDIGPSGKLLRPLGDLDFEDAVALFGETVRLGAAAGADLVVIETMNDAYETKAALLAAKENCDLPVIVTNAYGEDGKLMTGATPAAMAAMLEGMGADAIGANCSLGPRQLRGVVEELLRVASVPVVLKPNAGLPRVEDGRTVYDVTPAEFAAEIRELALRGVRLAGGCCGTTPAHIAALSAALADVPPLPVTDKGLTVVSSYTRAVCFGAEPVLIGERINPTGKKRFKEALRAGDMDYILNEGLAQAEAGAHLLDVNVGLPEIDEAETLRAAVCALQGVTDLPLQIDTADPAAMEGALRRYNGKAMLNSVSGKEESMRAVFPLAKKYGGVIVALTLDEEGIPETADGRVEIARRILKAAEKYGIEKKNIVFDPLALTVSADKNAARVTLEALLRIRRELGCMTSLGVSNVSFGLPGRDAVNATFFTLALEAGLSAAIMNPYSADMRRAYFTWRALAGLDENCADYISRAESFVPAAVSAAAAAPAAESGYSSELCRAVCKGLREQAAAETERLLQREKPLDIVNGEIIPALDRVGKGFEEKRVYLPQLLMAAEAAKAAFEVIKGSMAGGSGAEKGPFVLATVKGDIHDIGKNIVRLLLENYGWRVIDLGRDVPPEEIVRTVCETCAPIVGLSALMTTTVPAMEETILALRSAAPDCRIIVGGAVMTEEYAARIGADFYAADAMEGVRWAEEIYGEKK
ncbi:MAG: homocysteine S-methyltransferase family protein [Clostridia bacterium]|nr:homocysteine S-methyltransferase family protein [Clostridia bacterium]